MKLDWEQEHRTAPAASAPIGAFLGAALGADCFLAAERFAGVAAVLCGTVMAFCAVKGSQILSGRRDRRGVLLALPFIVVWGFCANHFCFALSAASGDPAAVWEAFTGVEAVLASAGAVRYWLQLSGLLETALAVWAVLFFLAGREEGLAAAAAQPCRATPELPPADMEFFLPWEPWIRPVRVWMWIRRCVCLGLLFLCGWMGRLVGHDRVWLYAMLGLAASALFAVSGQKRSSRICHTSSTLYVRTGGQLQRVNMNRVWDPELSIPLSSLARMWDRLPSGRQKLFRSTVAKAVGNKDGAAQLMENPRLEWESRWEWVVSGSMAGAKWNIPKVYPNFAPVSGVERAKGPLPFLWNEAAGVLVLTVLCVWVGCGLGLQSERSQADAPPLPSLADNILPNTRPPVPSPSADPGPVATARVPEEIGYYTLNGMSLQTDNAFEVTTNHIVDEENGVDYRISLQYGVGEEAVRAMLEKTQADDVRYLRPDSDDLLWRMGENTVVYQYNIRTAYLPDGQILHTGAALSERGTLFLVETAHGGEVEEEAVRGNLLYMLENLEFTGPAITGENYQEQLRPAVSMGFNYCGRGFLNAPPGLFGYDAFVDTFLPCGGTLNYYDDGLSVMTTVHGLRVSATIVPSDGTAMDALEEIYQDLQAAGRQYDEQNLFEEAYSPERNVACRITVYYDGGRTRATVLYTEGRWDGYYLFKEMTCLPEEIDGEYLAVLKEMEATCGLELPYMEAMGRFEG